MIQKTNVLAIGVKYLPSMPLNVKIGKKTIKMISTAKVAERTTLPAPASTSAAISSAVSVRPCNRRL